MNKPSNYKKLSSPANAVDSNNEALQHKQLPTASPSSSSSPNEDDKNLCHNDEFNVYYEKAVNAANAANAATGATVATATSSPSNIPLQEQHEEEEEEDALDRLVRRIAIENASKHDSWNKNNTNNNQNDDDRTARIIEHISTKYSSLLPPDDGNHFDYSGADNNDDHDDDDDESKTNIIKEDSIQNEDTTDHWIESADYDGVPIGTVYTEENDSTDASAEAKPKYPPIVGSGPSCLSRVRQDGPSPWYVRPVVSEILPDAGENIMDVVYFKTTITTDDNTTPSLNDDVNKMKTKKKKKKKGGRSTTTMNQEPLYSL